MKKFERGKMEKIIKNFELEKRKNSEERKYLSRELLDKLEIKKYRKLIEENDVIYSDGKCGYRLKDETYEKIKGILYEIYKDYYDLEDEEEKEMLEDDINSFFDNKKSLSVWKLFFEDRVLEECIDVWASCPYFGTDEDKLNDDLIPFDLIENQDDKIFLLHKVNGGVYCYYAFVFVIKIADSFDEFIERIEFF